MKPTVDGPEELHALLVLDRLPGVGLVRIRHAVERFGSATAALRAPSRAFADIAGREASAQRKSRQVRNEVDSALARAEDVGMTVLTWASPRYPDALWALADPPPVLFLRGGLELLGCQGVTVVGARRATIRARDIALRLGQGLAGVGVPVVSGLALGVDGAAHKGALATDGGTVAVLGTGADVAYPRSHARLFREILDRGLIVSEFVPGTPALPHHFPRRNRILAALGRLTVVVEAGIRSGSLITVDHALDLGRDVWVVPGPIERGACAGSNRLLTEGARPLLSLSHFIGELVPDATIERPDAHRPEGPHARVLRELWEQPLSADQIAERLDLPAHEVLGFLTALEVDGSVRRFPGMRFGRAA